MSASASRDFPTGQILVAIVNRYVVFEPEASLPAAIGFDPLQLPELLPRLGGEEDPGVEQRLVETLQLQGARLVREQGPAPRADFVVELGDGTFILVDVKVRLGRPRANEVNASWARSRQARSRGESLQTWIFDVDGLSLHTFGPGVEHTEMVARDVWERHGESLFTRANVISEVEQWEQRLRSLFAQVKEWLGARSDLVCEQNRSVTMSEELMQQFAVADRQLPVVDVVDAAGKPVASLVPRGLWLIGAHGRVDVITPLATHRLIGSRDEAGELFWMLGRAGTRQLVALDATSFIDLVAAP